jgi:ATP-binding cassette subfamily B protein
MFIFAYLRPYRKLLVAVLILGIINQVFSLLDPQVFRWITDNYITKMDTFKDTPELLYRGIGIGLGMMVGVAMVSRIAKNFQDYFANVMTQKMGMDIFTNTISHAFRIPYMHLEDQSSGQLLQKLQKARTDIQAYILVLINTAFLSGISLIFVITYAFVTHWLIGTVLLSLFPMMGITSYFLSKSIKKAQDGIVSQTAVLAGATTETIRNISLVKILGLERQELKRINNANEGILNLELLKIRKIRSMEFIQGTLINAIRVGLLGTMLWMIFKGYLTFGEFFSFFFYSFFIFAPLGQLGMVMKSYQEAKASNDVLEEIMKMPPAVEVHNPTPVDTIKDIKFDKVGFGYEGKENVLKNISLDMKAGKTIAFVGPSGSGKSTILKLLVGLYVPQNGTVTYNAKDIKTYNLQDLNKKIGIVTQDPQLFSGTIKDNLIFVKPDATDEECMKVLENAQMGEFMSEQKDWLLLKIGEGGLKLSGGQKQRLAIARALLRDPDLLIFDEATSSLDSIVEKEITDTIKKITKERPHMITILVAHRLGTVMHADQIMVLEKGSISETGTHTELLNQKGLYYALWREQIGERQEPSTE